MSDHQIPAACTRLLQAAKVYAFNYMQDEAEDEEDCVCGAKQHAEAKEVFAAIAEVEAITSMNRRAAPTSEPAAVDRDSVLSEVFSALTALHGRTGRNDVGVRNGIFDARAVVEGMKGRAPAAQEVPAAPQDPRLDDLSMLVRQLALALSKAAHSNGLSARALDYLKRKGLQGSPLRAAAPEVPAPAPNFGNSQFENSEQGAQAQPEPMAFSMDRLEQLIDKHTDKDFGLLVEPFAREIYADGTKSTASKRGIS